MRLYIRDNRLYAELRHVIESMGELRRDDAYVPAAGCGCGRCRALVALAVILSAIIAVVLLTRNHSLENKSNSILRTMETNNADYEDAICSELYIIHVAYSFRFSVLKTEFQNCSMDWQERCFYRRLLVVCFALASTILSTRYET